MSLSWLSFSSCHLGTFDQFEEFVTIQKDLKLILPRPGAVTAKVESEIPDDYLFDVVFALHKADPLEVMVDIFSKSFKWWGCISEICFLTTMPKDMYRIFLLNSAGATNRSKLIMCCHI